VRRPAPRTIAARTGAVAAAGLVLALSVTLVACNDGTATTAAPTPAGTTLDGRGLYAANCARCHGGDLKGTTQGPPFLDAVYRPAHHADAAFLIAVKNGVRPHHWNFGPMPPVEGLTDAQVAQITAFVREEQQAVGIR
jgi:mono/diheme cytochrome c family protein